jgi:predicted PurR-regulated permease PerM
MSDGGGPRERGGADRGVGRPSRWMYGVTVLGLFAAVLAAVRPVLSPFVLYALFLYLVWPRLDDPLYARLAAAVTGLMGLWLLEATGLLMAPFLLALLLAYVLDPVVDALQTRMPRPAAIGLLALPLLGVMALVIFVVAPAVGHQISQFISNVPGYVDVVQNWVDGVRAWVIGLGIEGITEQTVPRLRDIDAEALVEHLRERREQVTEGGLGAVLGIGRGVGTVLAALGYLVLLPVLTYYLLRDWDRIQEQIVELVPPAHRSTVFDFAGEYDRLLNRYLRGQLLLAAVVGLMIGGGFWIVGFPYPLLLGLIAGVFNVVPYVGLVISLAVALVIALFSGDAVTSLLKVAAVYGVEQVAEGFLGPRIVGESVDLHPVWVLLALALFGFFFGFVGLLIAVPAAVLVKLSVSSALRRYRGSAWFREGVVPGSAPEAPDGSGEGESRG